MDENNFEYLSSQVKYTGFGEAHQTELRSRMERQEPDFSLVHYASFGKDQVAALLHFRRSTETDRYFFNSYDVSLQSGTQAGPLQQTFYINNKESNFTFKEAYNLLDGRSVFKELTRKEGQKYHAWVQLDFTGKDKYGNYKMNHYHENYGFDLAGALSKYPLRELSDPEDKERLYRALERGNRQPVILLVPGGEKTVFVEAVPRFKSVNFYDGNLQRLRMDQLSEGAEQRLQESQSEANGQKTSPAGSHEPVGLKEKKGQRRKPSIS